MTTILDIDLKIKFAVLIIIVALFDKATIIWQFCFTRSSMPFQIYVSVI